MSIEKTDEHSYTIKNDNGWYSTSTSTNIKLDNELKSYDDYFVKDEITKSVMLDLAERSRRGYKKYNTTLQENNKDDYMNHLYEELLDAAQYIKKEQSIIPDVQKLIKQYPNDADLGEQIRLIYGKK